MGRVNNSYPILDNCYNFSFSYKDTSFGNYDIPSGAVIHEEEDHDDHDDHDEEEHEEHEEDLGYVYT